jgi:hypothetical protein
MSDYARSTYVRSTYAHNVFSHNDRSALFHLASVSVVVCSVTNGHSFDTW